MNFYKNLQLYLNRPVLFLPFFFTKDVKNFEKRGEGGGAADEIVF